MSKNKYWLKYPNGNSPLNTAAQTTQASPLELSIVVEPKRFGYGVLGDMFPFAILAVSLICVITMALAIWGFL